MTASRRERFERTLLAERARLLVVLDALSSAPDDSVNDRGRFGDDTVASSVGVSPDDDRALAAHTTRELADLDSALERLRDDPDHFGRCATCARPISLHRLQLVPGARYCRRHAPQ